MPNLLLIDASNTELQRLSGRFHSGPWQVLTANGPDQALRVLERMHIEVVCADEALAEHSGVELLKRIRSHWPLTQQLLVTTEPAPELPPQTEEDAAIIQLLRKPLTSSQLLAAADEAYGRYVELTNRLETSDATATGLTKRARLQLLQALVDRRTRELQTAKQEWESTFDAIGTPIAIVRSDNTVKRANLAHARMRGLDIRAAIGRPCFDVLFGRQAPCEGCPRENALASGQSTMEIEPERGRFFRVSAFAIPATGSVVCTYEDITEVKQRHEAEVHREKMVALGQLAGGVAHEINNPIASILAFAQLMKGDAGRTEDDAEALRLIEQSAVRCKKIVESMLRFSRKPGTREIVDCASVLRETVLLFNVMLKSHPRAKLELEAPDGLRLIADVNQLQQIILNLLQNAIQALPSGEGKIVLEAGQVDDRVFVRVRDNGAGIRPENLARIFEPTFTTKPPGQGTGFGLAIADAIVRDHGGTIQVESTPAQGTTFTVLLPRALN